MKMLMMGKYKMEVANEYCQGVNNELESLSPYIRSVVLHPKEVSIDVANFFNVVKRIAAEGVDTVTEYFAGIGVMTLMIEEMCKPVVHIISDYDVHCMKHLKKFFGTHYKNVQILEKGDAFTRDDFMVGELTSLDFNISFMRWFNGNTGHRQLLDRTIAAGPKLVHMSDKSLAYFHVNKSKYAQIMGRAIDTPADYVQGMSEIMYNAYGYSLIYYPYYRTSGHILLMRGKHDYVMEDMSTQVGCLSVSDIDDARKGVI